MCRQLSIRSFVEEVLDYITLDYITLPLLIFVFFYLVQAVNRIPSRKNREMITSFYSQVLQFEQAAGRE